LGEEIKCDRKFRGFGGRRFIIEMEDGTIHVTTNLWCQGGIPEIFRSELPNNSVFFGEFNPWDYTFDLNHTGKHAAD
jgi:hypothetical protein